MGNHANNHVEYDRSKVGVEGHITLITPKNEKKRWFKMSPKSLRYTDSKGHPSKNKAFFDQYFKIINENISTSTLTVEVRNIRGQNQQWTLKFDSSNEYST